MGLPMIRALQLLLLGAASFGAVYFFVAPRQTDNPAGQVSQASPGEEIQTGSVLPEDTAPPEATPPTKIDLRPGVETVLPTGETPLLVRDVTPPTMTARPRPTTLAQAHAPSPTPAAPAEKDRQERLFNPIVVGAGTLKTRDGEIHLAGIAAPAFEAMCGENPAQWPCGHMARAALQKFIHSRAVECTIPAGADKIPDPAECQVGGDDMSEWLVAQGWAKRDGAKFEDEEEKAREAKLGLWSPRRPIGHSTAIASGGG